mgnify:CR=1 FL=1
MAMTREERDSLGPVNVASGCLWGAQTQRAVDHFRISIERMPTALLHAMASVKLACAQVNGDLGLLPVSKARAIMAARCGSPPDAVPRPPGRWSECVTS